ncbi:tRNA lysidine(34) synthetase TilS [Thermosipho atlanticus]|uniref:tRNA(Ile)-lysidine synthase n=1 Tax=Thermosipho atlanticus DSM 15807 TaxID=1123380 RepID=A0A1M5RXD8_9BACT|nr:tRNA lysidine(34) synthetase TilS [Thermosipho atlanticus]SHH30916.1 tRNA(Ile)-lysidine synthase [Thermosipho atlanticus DSM 15807]
MLDIKTFHEILKRWQLVEKNDKILVAVSGGVDSLVLLYLLNSLKKDLNIELVCATLNHGIRESAYKDVEHVISFSNKLGIKCITGKVDVPKYAEENKLSIEEAARKLRYEFLERNIKTQRCNKLAVAHNLNDLVENVLFRLSRGAGPFGLPGMKPKNGNTIRPLLFFSKDEILEFAKKNGIDYVIDETNLNTIYTRNFIRHEIVPLFKQLNPSFERSVKRLIENIWDLDEFIEKQLNVKIYKIRGRLYFDVLDDTFLFVEFIRRITINYYGKAPDKEKLDRLKGVLSRRKTTFKISFWNNFGLEVSYGKALLGEFLLKDDFEYVVHKNETIDLDPFVVKLENNGIIINKDKIKGELILRNWRNGDKTKTGKKIKEIFVSKKIPSFLRRIIPVFADKEKIIYIPKVYIDKECLCKNLDDKNNVIGINVQLKGGFSF